jgi:hypothetical protein
MIIIREYDHIGPHVVHNYPEPLEQGINSLTGEMSEIRTLSGKSHTSEPEPEHFQREHPSTAPKPYKPSPLSEPDRIRIYTEHKTSMSLNPRARKLIE